MKTFNELKSRNMLSKAEMLNIKGGKKGTCAVMLDNNRELIARDISIWDVQYVMDAGGYTSLRWCCDSCSKATWL
ncbi:MAG: hypothetical protein NC226_05985 [Bacteroides cellulosilyticus]|nr:hypothetical protein [Bacteroides cellulosilyticus]